MPARAGGRWPAWRERAAAWAGPTPPRRIVDECCRLIAGRAAGTAPTGQRANGPTGQRHRMYRQKIPHPLRGHRRHRHERHRRAAAQPRLPRVAAPTSRRSDITRAPADAGRRASTTATRPSTSRGADVVVVSSAVRPDNPEVLAAQQRSHPGHPAGRDAGRADAPEVRRRRRRRARQDHHHLDGRRRARQRRPGPDRGDRRQAASASAPTPCSGAATSSWPRPTRATARSCSYSPAIAVVTNIDREHLDYYPDLDRHPARPSCEFIDQRALLRAGGRCAWTTSPSRRSSRRSRSATRTYGMSPQADFQIAQRAASRAGAAALQRLPQRAASSGAFKLQPARASTTCYNAAGRRRGGRRARHPVRRASRPRCSAFAACSAASRSRARSSGVTVVDDYGHHPTEIKATLQAARDGWPERRVVVVFQPHRYTRTRALLDEFATGLLPVRRAGRAADLRRERGPDRRA
ncbi:MAG: hypothetical protein MZV70_49820 [Desulfobacterales bacterium]|nr:hypothetical protein [Desulfobacterales bacterium]